MESATVLSNIHLKCGREPNDITTHYCYVYILTLLLLSYFISSSSPVAIVSSFSIMEEESRISKPTKLEEQRRAKVGQLYTISFFFYRL